MGQPPARGDLSFREVSKFGADWTAQFAVH